MMCHLEFTESQENMMRVIGLESDGRVKGFVWNDVWGACLAAVK